MESKHNNSSTSKAKVVEYICRPEVIKDNNEAIPFDQSRVCLEAQGLDEKAKQKLKDARDDNQCRLVEGPEVIACDDNEPVPRICFEARGLDESSHSDKNSAQKAKRNVKKATDGSHCRSAQGPEVLSCDDHEPVPATFCQNNKKAGHRTGMSMFMKSLSGHINAQKVLPDKKGIPIVEEIGDLQSSGRCGLNYDRVSVKSHHSSGNGLSLSEKGLAVACPVTDEKPIYEASEYDPSAKKLLYNSTKCRILTVLALLVAGAIIAGGVVYAYKIRSGDVSQILTMTATTYRQTSIQQMIEDNVLERNVTFAGMKDTDPRYLALDWIVKYDGQRLSVSDPNLVQRYILALLAFSLDLNSWECGMVKDLDNCNTTSYDYTDHALWLSRTHECFWYGVECEDGLVQELDLGRSSQPLPFSNATRYLPR
jgi:hypothetical protein